MIPICCVCGDSALFTCGRCNIIYYCSKECQLYDWKNCHKNNCIKKLTKEDFENCVNINGPTYKPSNNNIVPESLTEVTIDNSDLLFDVVNCVTDCVIAKKYMLALSLIDKCIESSCYKSYITLSSFYVLKSMIYTRMNDYQNAVNYLHNAIQINPQNSIAYSNLSLFYQASNKTEIAFMLKQYSNKLYIKKPLPAALCLCNRPGFFTCSKCKLSCYCSKYCQQKDWKLHKTKCFYKLTPIEIQMKKKIELNMIYELNGVIDNTKSFNDVIIDDPLVLATVKVIDNSKVLADVILGINTCIFRGDHNLALVLLDKCKSMYYNISYETLSRICVLKAAAYTMMNKYLKAEKNLRKSIQLNPHNQIAYTSLAMYYKIAGKSHIYSLLQRFPLTFNQRVPIICSCGKSGIFKCSKCERTCYCSKKCQKMNWKFHKINCVL